MNPAQPPDDAERRALDAYVKLRRAVNALQAREAETLREAGLTESQFLGAMCQKELARKILKSAGNLTTVIGNLERNGLVTRCRSGADRRVMTIDLTRRGRRLVQSIFPRHAAVLTRAFAVLEPEEQLRLGSLCKRLGTQSRE
jgi:MarR family 2-MHQ and catechol resistance regulon transcriptional repressor